MYWVTSNTFSCIQTAAFKVPGVKNALGIPTIVPPPPAAATSLPNSTAPLNFSSSLKDIPPPPSASLTDAPLPEADHQNSAVNRKNRKKKQRKRRKK
jgi:membrane protein insertase Oxa1/YidC/SpoIIIJ